MAETGKFNIVIDGTPREIVISLGVRGELFKLLTTKQIEYQGLATKSLLGPGDVKTIQELSEQLSLAADDDESNKLRREIDAAYAAAFKNVEINQHRFMQELALASITLGEDSIVELLAQVLTVRDHEGKITNKVEADELRWSPEYTDAQDALMDLAIAVVEYLSEALKKISKFNTVVHNLQPPVQG